MLLFKVASQELSDDGLSLVPDVLDNPVLDLKDPPDEPCVHVLPLFESPCDSAYLHILALLVGLTAPVTASLSAEK